MNVIPPVFAALLGLSLLLLAAPAAVGQEGYRPEGFAVAPEGALDVANCPAPLYRCPIFDGAADPSVVYDPAGKSWTIYYTQRRANQVVQGVGWCYGTKIGIATSTDAGRNWEYQGVCLGLSRGKQAETFWAPHVWRHEGKLHMIVTYIPRIGGNGNWGGKAQLAHYTSDDGEHWKDEGLVDVGSDNIIDPAVILLKDGRWLLVFRDDNAGVKTAMCVSTDLKTWKRLPEVAGDQEHEGPVVFYWKDQYWMLTDDWKGLGVYTSENGIDYKRNGRILEGKGKRTDDGDQGRHAGVMVAGEKAFVVYFTHPGRHLNVPQETSPQNTTPEFNRSSLQIAELGAEGGKLVAHRDKYAK